MNISDLKRCAGKMLISICLIGAASPAVSLNITFFHATSNIGVASDAYPNGIPGYYESLISPTDLTYRASDRSYNFSRASSASAVVTQFGSTSSGSASFATSLKVQPGVIKASNGSTASVATVINPRGQSPQNRASALESIAIYSLDRLTFAFVDPSVTTAQVKVTFAARVSGNVVTNYDSSRGTVTGGTSWGFGGDARVHKTANSVFGNAGFGEVLQLDRWNAGGFVNTANYYTNCAGLDACYNSGVQIKTAIMNVSRGNVLWIQNYFGSQTQSTSTLYQAPTRTFPSADISSSIDFGHSAYTLIEMLTPGVTYTADSGATYLTTLPTVPEPANWALMIVGFGMIGAALRRHDRLALIA